MERNVSHYFTTPPPPGKKKKTIVIVFFAHVLLVNNYRFLCFFFALFLSGKWLTSICSDLDNIPEPVVVR